MTWKRVVATALTTILLAACGDEKPKKKPAPAMPTPEPPIALVSAPTFSAESAYNYIQKQVNFGPRVPNTASHKACASWLQSELKSFGLEVVAQHAVVKAFNGQDLSIVNIMGRYKPETQKRILLCAHWDSRPYADRDTEHRTKAIDGANDGASGVGVLLELARAITSDSNQPEIGFDLVFFDAEDYGKPNETMTGEAEDSWCLGSQYWAANIPVENYRPQYAILLDMVGAKDATFPKEAVSMAYAPHVVDRVWKIAHALGHKNLFKDYQGVPITDDHVYLNQVAKIPAIDIIHYEMPRRDFGSFHHTHRDNMDIIDRATLQAVGEVMMQVVYGE